MREFDLNAGELGAARPSYITHKQKLECLCLFEVHYATLHARFGNRSKNYMKSLNSHLRIQEMNLFKKAVLNIVVTDTSTKVELPIFVHGYVCPSPKWSLVKFNIRCSKAQTFYSVDETLHDKLRLFAKEAITWIYKYVDASTILSSKNHLDGSKE